MDASLRWHDNERRHPSEGTGLSPLCIEPLTVTPAKAGVQAECVAIRGANLSRRRMDASLRWYDGLGDARCLPLAKPLLELGEHGEWPGFLFAQYAGFAQRGLGRGAAGIRIEAEGQRVGDGAA